MTAVDFRLSVVAPGGTGVPVDLLLRTPAGATTADLRASLAEASGYAGLSPRLFIHGEPVPEDLPVGTAPLLQGCMVTLDDPGMRPDRAVPGVLELRVVGGPDSGHTHRLVPGDHVIGRGAEATVRVEDPDLSRRHALLRVRHSGVTVEDLGSTNGTTLDGHPVNGTPREISTAGVLRLGSTTVGLWVPTETPAATAQDGLGHVLVNRSPRLLPALAPAEVVLPTPPRRREATRLPLVATLVPLLLAVPMALLAHSPLYLLFGLMSPLILVGNVIGDRRRGGREHRQAVAEHDRALEAAHAEVAEALHAEAGRRRAQLPDHAELLATVSRPLTRLWERRRTDEDALLLRVGIGDLLSQVTVVDPAREHRRTTPEVAAVPVGIALREVGVLGLTGPREAVTSLARGLVAQTCGWHSPRDVRLVVLAADAERGRAWAWTAHLPHTRPSAAEDCQALLGVLSTTGDQVRRRVAELAALVAERRSAAGAGGPAWAGSRVVVLLAGSHRLRAVPGMAALLEHGPGVGMHFICLDDEAARLPLEAHATVQVTGTASTRLTVQVSGAPAIADVVADQVSAGWAERFARALAPLRDATPEEDTTEVPDEARLLDVLPYDATDAAAVRAQWARCPRSTMALLGVAAEGPYAVDLRREGPHLLIGGTTGAGKSELLQTVIASLALANRPDQLSFVLVDYKGGAAFKDCAQLPHTVGLVTDLDAHLADRALTSLRAELTRRERVLRSVGAKDIEEHHARAAAGDQVLPRLVLVIDEFRVLAEELPAFLEGVLRIAAVGRSLGVHLVLATQRPAGVVTADIKANVALRIALRVRDRLDSEDLVEAPDAAAISERTPGRAFLRSGAGPLVRFQTARVGGHGPDHAAPAIEAIPVPADGWGDAPPPSWTRPDATGPTDLARIVAATQEAATALGLEPVASPWLPPLTTVLPLADLRPETAMAAPWAVLDRPGAQTQEVLAWDLDHGGHLALAGAPRTGRTTALRTLAGSLATHLAPADVHVHALDGGSGGLRALTHLPHTGTVVTPEDLPRAARLVARVVEEVGRRQALLGASGLGSVTEQRCWVAEQGGGAARPPGVGSVGEQPRTTGGAGDDGMGDGGGPLPYLVLLVDGWEVWARAFESVDHGRPTEQLLRILREGPAAGVRVALTGDRSILLSQVASAVPDKLVLRLSDPTDLVMAGIPSAAVPAVQPPGRAVRAHDHAEVQIALLDGDGTGAAQARALLELGRRCAPTPAPAPELRPLRIEPLPQRISVAQVRARRSGADDRQWALVGVGGDEAGPVGLDVMATPAVLVAGPPGSGRSSTLATMAGQLAASGRPLAVVSPRRSSPLPQLVGDAAEQVDPHDREALASLLKRHDDLVVAVDDAELVLDTPCEEVLVEQLRHGEPGPTLLCAGGSEELAGLFRGLTVEARKHRTGVLLQPTGLADGDLLGIRVRSGDPGPPGRGLLVAPGRVVPVQVALPDAG